MKNNIKKAPVKFWEDLLCFQQFMLIFSSPEPKAPGELIV